MGDRQRILHGGNFPQLLPPQVFTYFFGHTLDQKGGEWTDDRIIDLYMIDILQKQSPFFVASLIIHTIIETLVLTPLAHVCSVTPVILSHVFTVFNVNFIGERRAHTG